MQAFSESELELLSAIQGDEFVMYYQPQYNLVTSTFVALEALIRWKHPQRGLILPDQFIDLAESSGFIIGIGGWALKTACTQFKVWQAQKFSPVRIAVNVTARQLRHSNFANFVNDTLYEVGLSPDCLELELNEHIIIEKNDKMVIRTIEKLNEAGVQITLDDFDTGHSNVEYLKRIPVRRIKIAKAHIDHHVKFMVTLASEHNLQLVAEGVETLKQLEMLKLEQCTDMQGNYFSEPLSTEQMQVFLTANRK